MINVKALFFGTLVCFLVGCSLQSRQLDSINRLFAEDTDDLLERSSWSADWDGSTYTLYAVNTPQEVIFGFDKRLRIHFDGWQITEFVGFLSDQGQITIELQESDLLYFVNDRLLASHECTDWVGTAAAADAIEYHQACDGREPYMNEIDVGSDGLITRLEFLIHPEYPPLIMAPLNKDDSNE